MTENSFDFKHTDLMAIERRAQAMRAQAVAEMVRALRAAIVARLQRSPKTRAA
ncbi:RSP_7527 family protein [Pararhodobacter sp.]|uniref:RSP_7527 family protein n=1 Tax=Pararhodobacter sp. TaxID=2127056 RepID=UPI002B002145|nr:hypothetical protein [Pararhodobacter sp.]